MAPQAPTSDPRSPLGRSGLDLMDVLTTTDLVASRQPTGAVALEVGLEQARSALLRNLPGESLAALDGVWERARRTEEGWYLRSGALTVMGLPGECDRVAGEGLAARPDSTALRFVQSLARMGLGDLSGARATLQPALTVAPREPVLLAQHAVMLGRQGDRAGAEAALARIAAVDPEHPALLWARQTLRSQNADATRQRSRPTPIDSPSLFDLPRGATPIGDPLVRETPGNTPPTGDERDVEGRPSDPTPATAAARSATDAERPAIDVTASALERFGARVAMRPPAEVSREARLLMRAFSAGGTLATAVSADQAHAARVVLATFLGVATGEGSESPGPVRSMIEQLVPLLQQGRAADAERLVRRQSVLAREPIGRLLLSVIRGSSVAPFRDAAPTAEVGAPESKSVGASGLGTPGFGAPVVRGEADRGPVIPVRLGLALLEETPAARAAVDLAAMASSGSGRLAAAVDSDATIDGGVLPAARSLEEAGAGWGAARAAASAERSEWSRGAGVRAIALVCVALAMTALVNGHGAMAIGLAAGAAWLAVRRSGREATPPRRDH
jgi:hypothetical protein